MSTQAPSSSTRLSSSAAAAAAAATVDSRLDEVVSRLAAAGWDGHENTLELAGSRQIPLYKFKECTFQQKDFEKIQAAFRERISTPVASTYSFNFEALKSSHPSIPPSTIPTGVSSPISSVPQNTYENARDLLREHLSSLKNPFLAQLIVNKLSGLKTSSINWAIETQLIDQLTDKTWPHDTREHFTTYARMFRTKALQTESNLDNTIEAMKNELCQIIEELKTRTDAALNVYKDWRDFLYLFAIPTFAQLSSSDFNKLIRCVDQRSPDALRETIDALDKLRTVDLQAAEAYLKSVGYEYDLDTLVGEVIENIPRKSEGIVYYWNQPKEFFTEKTLSLNAPDGTMQHGVIVRCDKTDNTLIFYLDDSSEVHIQGGTYQTQVIRRKTYSHLFHDIILNLLREGERFTIEHQGEATMFATIPVGEYTWKDYIFHRGTAFGLLSNPYHEFKLVNSATKETYRIRGEVKNEQVIAVHVAKEEKRGSYLLDVTLSLSAFEICHTAVKKITTEVREINASNADRHITIKNEPNEDRARRQHLEQINRELTSLREELQKPENETLLDQLLTNIAANQMKAVDFNLLKAGHPILADRMSALSRKYLDTLQISRTPADILKETTLDANYVKLVNIKDNILIVRTMKLLKKAKKHIQNIEGKDLALFMGNTGSGKSTSIAHLMGAPMKKRQNHVGETVLYVAENTHLFPGVGQSIGTSETIYTQGYSIPGYELLLGDCPGFNDTRGGDFELCTNFSIDQAVLQSKHLRSIVIVVPVSAFLLDRGNPVIELINSVRDRFPFTFDPDHYDRNQRVFLLITKQGQSKDEVVRFMKDGKRFEELVKETKNQIDTLIRQGSTPDSFEVKSIERRQRIWQAIAYMHKESAEESQVHFIDIGNKVARERLLKIYSAQDRSLDKEQYVPAMANEYMHKKFGDSVQMAAHAWITLILGKYLETLPEAIGQFCRTKEKRLADLKEYDVEMASRMARARALGENITELEALVQLLDANSTNLSDPKLRQQLLDATKKSANGLVDRETDALNETKRKLTILRSDLDDVRREIRKYNTDIASNTTKIQNLRAKITQLETGDHIDHLYEDVTDPNSKLTLWNIKQGARETRINAVEGLTQDDLTTQVYADFARNYVGKTSSIAIIQRGYRLVPSDPAQRQAFLDTGTGGGFIAKVEGVRYRIDLGRRATADGQKVGYGYELDWNGTPNVPSISITHTIPNREYNYAQINSLNATIQAMQNQILSWNLQLNGGGGIVGATTRENDLKQEIMTLEQEQQRHEKRIEELRTAQALEQVQEMRRETTQRLERIKREKVELEDQSAIMTKKAATEKELARIEQQIAKLEKEKRNLAIIIKTQWKSALLLREFADYVLGSPNDPVNAGMKHLNATLEQCQKFIEIFDKYKGTLLEEIQATYKF